MKKILIAISVAALFVTTPVFADDELNVDDAIVVVEPGEDDGYFSAKITNTSNSPQSIGSGKLVVLSDDDAIITTEDYIYSFPSDLVLMPGEYTYVTKFIWNSNLEMHTVDDFKFSVEAQDNGTVCERIPCDSRFVNGDPLNSLDYVELNFTNDSGETRYGYYCMIALYDQNDKLFYTTFDRQANVGIFPGSTLCVKVYIDGWITDYMKDNNISISKTDVLCYYDSE